MSYQEASNNYDMLKGCVNRILHEFSAGKGI